VDYYKAEVLRQNDYYPFGMQMPGRTFTVGSSYRYGFNGKENDNEVKNKEGTQQDYGMRIYDTRLGRFLSVDPLTKSYPMLTPYQFGNNSPIKNIDLDGAESLPNEIWNSLKNYGKNLIKQTTEHIVNRTIKSVDKVVTAKTEEKLDNMVNSKNQTHGMIGVTGEFLLGLGPENRSFGPNHPLTKSLAESKLAKSAEEKFVSLNREALEAGDFKSVKNFTGLVSFGMTGIFDNSGILTESLDNTAQMVGSATFTVSLSKDHQTLNFHVYDTKNRYSLFYHGKIPGIEALAKSKTRDDEPFLGTTQQTYDWSKKFDEKKYLKGEKVTK
jgi:RHS repeat-associated protein